MKNKKPGFFQKYKKYLLIAIAIYIALTVLLIFFSSGPQEQPFVYQVF